ncbi:MAG: UvrD-helicase domain-containing protein [Candidatus Amulumruptor caecigallinarius]|nr:UvrD-helicase domain-containing protein [Candidatus Amulumruptor caecigallinarius]MCM1396263.1 UvrD-helicase domain-containing protein [Candidatus Amulumruptor caecigallinarius]MCM1454257.1 UvrD-helicase domain-containing protein [bacterium]
MTEEYLTHLNDQQREAVTYTDGPQLVIAGAGSGKTRVLTYKILHLLAKGVEPWRILALTFTNKAAREMRERIEALVGPTTASKLWMGTFHSIFARILRIHADRIGYRSDYTIYDAADSKALIKLIIKDMELDDKLYKPAVVASAISWAKNSLISPADYAANRELMEADRRARRPRIAEVYAAYCSRCRVAKAMDFDDLLYYTNLLLRDNPDIRNHYAEYFRYVLVDEYQDTNFAQHLIVSQLCEGHGSLMVVGDDAQSIYSFRGANIANILNLNRTYPKLRVFKLEQNYRSTQTIINAANSLIDKNRDQIPKTIFSLNAPGERIELVEAYSDYEESFIVASRISRLKRVSNDSYDDFAILYRTNAQSRVLEESLRKQGIPYRIYGGLSFYQRKEVKDAVGYFRLAVNPDDDEALRRVINFPARGIGETTLGRVSAAAISGGVSLWHVITHLDDYETGINRGTRGKLDGFRAVVEPFIAANSEGATAADLAEKIITDTGMISMLQHDRTPESISRIENLQELLNGARQFVKLHIEAGETDRLSMAQFLTEVSLATDQDSDDDTDGAKVTLMTVHAAKGLEFGNVFVVGVEEELFPSSRSKDDPAAIEEERRLLYVAITRAKRFCMISYAASRFRNGVTERCVPSRFIRDIDGRYLRPVGGTDVEGRSRVNPVERYRDSFHSPSTVGHRNTTRGRSQEAALNTIAFPGSRGASSRPATSTRGASGSKADGSLHTASELAAGMRIEHGIFGKGLIEEVVTDTADHKIKVQFDNSGFKTLMLKFARFNIL